MNTMLCVLLALDLFVTFCDALCTYTPLEIAPGGEEGCKDTKGVVHKFHSRWKYACISCSCNPRFGITCCSTVMRPKNYDKDKCKEIFNKETCKITVVEKVNPAVRCKVTGYIG